MEKVSVIVPIYNVEQYLAKCINSIISQTYDNIEIILVDDGSTDMCPLICDNYAKIDERIIVIHKANGGLSDARNAGIELASGDYITLIDSDDYIAKDYIETLRNFIKKNNADISICDFATFNDKGFIKLANKSSFYSKVYTAEQALECALLGRPFLFSAWGKMYKKHLFNEIRYPKDKIFEDLGTTYKLFDKCKVITFINVKLYYYYIRNNSISYSRFSYKKMDMLYFAKELNEFIRKKYPRILYSSKIRICISAIDLLRDIGVENDHKLNQYRNYCFYELKKNRKKLIFNFKVNFKYKIFAILSFFGEKSIAKFEKINRHRKGIS